MLNFCCLYEYLGMQYLKVSPINETVEPGLTNVISGFLDKREKSELAFSPWTAYPYKPEVKFTIAHTGDKILLKYYVKEKTIRAAGNRINASVWEDSCVEFFISFDEKGYYNFEFNCIGTGLLGFGKGKTDRELLPAESISRIGYQANITNGVNGLIEWELALVIPSSVFVHHPFSSLKGKQCRANFYKCGDLLPEPHFVTWSDIKSPEPNFHLPDFFGTLVFE